MLNKITAVLGFLAFILTSLQVWRVIPRTIPYAFIILMIMEFMWGIKSIKDQKDSALILFVGGALCGVFSYMWIF